MRIRERGAPIAVQPTMVARQYEPAGAVMLSADKDRGAGAAKGETEDRAGHDSPPAIRSSATPKGPLAWPRASRMSALRMTSSGTPY
jgi:hypothetical protein